MFQLAWEVTCGGSETWHFAPPRRPATSLGMKNANGLGDEPSADLARRWEVTLETKIEAGDAVLGNDVDE